MEEKKHLEKKHLEKKYLEKKHLEEKCQDSKFREKTGRLQMHTKKTPKRLKQTIRHDSIHPVDFLKYNFTSSCEQCSHFDPAGDQCTFGYDVKFHKSEPQRKSYNLSGTMALCRFHEID